MMKFARKILLPSMLCCFLGLQVSVPALVASDTNKDSTEIKNLVDGGWSGHVTSGGISHEISANFAQVKDKIDGTILWKNGNGQAKHYLKGAFSSNDSEFKFDEVGVDADSASVSSTIDPIESYSFHLVEGGKKIVGSAKQSNKKVWIVLQRPSEDAQTLSPTKSMPEVAQTSTEKLFKKAPNLPSQEKAKITPEVVAYMTYVERTLKTHWHPPHAAKSRQVMTLFKIHADGTVSDVRIDNQKEAPKIDEASEAALDAIKLCAPFQPLTTSIQRDVNDDFLNIKFSFDYNVRRRSSVPMLLFGRGAILLPSAVGQ